MTDPLPIAQALLVNPTAPFFEDLPAAHVRAFAAERGLEHETDAAGNVLVKYGTGTPLVLMAHLDHPGFHTTPGDVGVVDLTFKGGLAAVNALPETPVRFFRRGAVEPVGRGRLVDTTADDRGFLATATAGVVDGEVADFAMWDLPDWSIEDGRITARVCDDLLGCAAILSVLDEIASSRPSTCVWGLFTRAEEEGFLGAFEAIRLETVPKDADVLSLECSKALAHAPQGGGVIVRVGDRMSIFDPSLTAAMEAAAATVDGLTFQRRLMDGGACEATAFCAAGYRASGIAVPLGGYHNASDGEPGIVAETVMVSDYLGEVQLLTALAHNPDLLRPSGPPAWFATRSAKARALSRAESSVPELPEMQALSERLAEVMVGKTLTGAQPIQFAGLKTYAPAPESLFGSAITDVSRIGKYVVMTFEGGERMLLHLSQAGRLDVETPAKTTRPKQGVVRWTLGDGTGILVKEFGTERKAGWWLLAPGDDGPLERLGPEPGTPEFAELIRTNAENRRIHIILRDQKTVSGMGRGYTDDALWKAKLSPYATFKSLTAEDRERLLDAIDFVMTDGLMNERKIEGGYPTKKTKHWMVHNKHGQPCPACETTLERISFSSYEITYCPACQTDGKILADRRTSRFLK